MSKIFIVGLPRTGTTSLCAYLLEHKLKVAHTAYTQQSIILADVIADTPVYCDFIALDKTFSHSKFILLTRKRETWLPSIRQLLSNVVPRFGSSKKGINPIIERCLMTVFPDLSATYTPSAAQLTKSYLAHHSWVKTYFKERPDDLITINVSQPADIARLNAFLGLSCDIQTFPYLNRNGKISDWEKLKHAGKVSSHARGEYGRRYFSFDNFPVNLDATTDEI